jgi:DNA-binding MarR family transcriptional regulator
MTIMASAIVGGVSERAAGIEALAERIPFLLSQLGAQTADNFQRRLAPLGADPRTYAVLLALAATDGQSQRQLSEQLGIHRNVMVSVIDNLEAKGLVRRLPHPEDRRAFAITLTDMARRLLPALEEQGRALEDEITAPLSAPERTALRKSLQRMSAAAGLIPGVHPGLG